MTNKMSLWTVDGSTNSVDEVTQRQGSGTTGFTNKQDPVTGGKLLSKDGQLISNDGTNNRVLVGYSKDGFGTGFDYGIKVSQTGYDVLTATDSQLVMSSKFNQFKIVASGTSTVSAGAVGGTTYTTVLPHGLSVVPAFQIFIQPPTSITGGSAQYYAGRFAAMSWSGAAWTQLDTAYALTDSTNITFVVAYGGSAPNTTWTFRYYILQETAS